MMSREMDHARLPKAVVVLFVILFALSGLALTASAQDPPTLFLRTKATKDAKIALDWEITNETNVAKYNIYWDTKEIDDISGLTPDATTTDMEYTISGLERGTKYYFTVAAVDTGATILTQGSDSNTPGVFKDVGSLKKVNYWNIMTFTGIILVIFLFVLWRIPTYVKEEKGMGGI